MSWAICDDVVRWCQLRRPAEPNVRSHQRPHDQQRPAHVEPAVTDERVRQRVVRLATRFVHREEVGQHLRRVPLVGQPVVDGDAGVRREFLDVGLGVAAELDGVVHPTEDPGGVGDRLLVSELRTGRIEIGDVGPLVEGGHLESGAGARRGLLEDEGDLLALETLRLETPVLRRLQRLGETQQVAQFVRPEVDLLQETPVSQVEHVDPPSIVAAGVARATVWTVEVAPTHPSPGGSPVPR